MRKQCITFEQYYFDSRYGVTDNEWNLYCLKRLVHRHVTFLTEHIQGNASYLDVGCGRGNFLEVFAPYFKAVVGTDVSQFATSTCRKKGFPTIQCDARALSLGTEAFDAAILIDVLEHFEVEDGFLILSELRRVLKPNGHLLIVIPNWHHRVVKDQFFNDFTHRTIYTKVSLKNIAESVGFQALVKEEYTLTGVPGVGILANRLKQYSLAYSISYTYSVLTQRRLHLVLYGQKT